MFKKILFPTDYSKTATNASSYVEKLRDTLGASQTNLHVNIDDGLENYSISNTVTQEESLHVEVQASSASEAIVQYATDSNSDLIVMGTHGRTGLSRMFLGSIAERVVREATCHILTVRESNTSVASWDNGSILVPTDFSNFAQESLKFAVCFAKVFNMKIYLVHAVQQVAVPCYYEVQTAPIADEALRESAQIELDKLATTHFKNDVSIQTQVLFGYPASELTRFATSQEINLIIMASHGLTGFEHFLLGSVTEKVVRTATCPVLTYKSFHA